MNRLLLFLLIVNFSFAQTHLDSIFKDIKIKWSTQSQWSNRDYQPHYSVFQQWGKVRDKKFSYFTNIQLEHLYHYHKYISLNTKLDVIYDGKEVYLNEIYLHLNAYHIDVFVGQKAKTYTQYSDELTAGDFGLGSNTRPLPHIAIGLFEYTDVPFTKGYLKLKATLVHSWLQEKTSPISYYQMHYKNIYVSTGNLWVNVFAGAQHIAYYGGSHQDPKIGDLPADVETWWRVMRAVSMKTPTSTGKILASEEYNAYGNHLGAVKWGITFEIKDYSFTIYQQKPIDDGAGYLKFFRQNKDNFFGFIMRNPKQEWMSELVLEYIDTTYQNGLGLSDPHIRDPNNKKSYVQFWRWGSFTKEKVLMDYLAKRFGEHVRKLSNNELIDFMEKNINGGYRYGGRTPYYDHHYFPNIYKGNTLGTSLFYTRDRFYKLTGLKHDRQVVNSAIKALHIGVKGKFGDFDYLLKYTFSKNYGLVSEAHHKGKLDKNGEWIASFEPKKDYYFYSGKTQSYTFLQLGYNFQIGRQEFKVKMAFSKDFGQIYEAMGGTFGISWKLS